MQVLVALRAVKIITEKRLERERVIVGTHLQENPLCRPPAGRVYDTGPIDSHGRFNLCFQCISPIQV